LANLAFRKVLRHLLLIVVITAFTLMSCLSQSQATPVLLPPEIAQSLQGLLDEDPAACHQQLYTEQKQKQLSNRPQPLETFKHSSKLAFFTPVCSEEQRDTADAPFPWPSRAPPAHQ
jgi:hypothetical protein